MNRLCTILLLCLLLTGLSAFPAPARASAGANITSPAAGDPLRGTVAILGTTSLDGFQSYRIDFAYADDVTGTWFNLASSSQPVDSGQLAAWDTTQISDGNYKLRLQVFLSDGTRQEIIVDGLRVRNYTAVETPTPAPTAVAPTLTPTQTLRPTQASTPTPLATNPAVLTPNDLGLSIGYGGAAALVLLLVLGAYLWIRRK